MARGQAPLLGVVAVISAGFLLAVAVVAMGRAQLSQRVVLAGKPDQWYADYLMQPASAYSMEGAEGLSSTFPFKDPPYGGPLHLLHQVTRAQASLAVQQDAPAGFPLQRVMRSASQQLCGLDSGCEYHTANNLKVAMGVGDVGKDFKWESNDPPSDGVVNEVKSAIADYQKDIDLEIKVTKGTKTNAFAVNSGQARTQILCGLDAGCEDDMSSEMGIAQKVDKDTVMADLPDLPDTDAIDEVWKAVADKRMDEEESDKYRRGVGVP